MFPKQSLFTAFPCFSTQLCEGFFASDVTGDCYWRMLASVHAESILTMPSKEADDGYETFTASGNCTRNTQTKVSSVCHYVLTNTQNMNMYLLI